MGKRFTFFTLCMTLFVMFSTSVFAGTSKTYYSKAVVKAVGQGTVYVNTANEDTDAVYAETAEKTYNSSTTDNRVNHVYFLFAKPAYGFKLEGWYDEEGCETAAAATKQDNGSYRVSFSTNSQKETSPIVKNYFAKFIEATEFYSSKVTVTSTGIGNVAVSTEPNPQDFGAEKSASKIHDVEPDHTYYLNADVEDAEAYRFVGWYSSEECDSLISNKASYTYKVIAESMEDENPTEFHVYAKFEAIPYYYSTVVATAVGNGAVAVRGAQGEEPEYDVEREASIVRADVKDHTYYLSTLIEDADEVYFGGWYSDEECTELISQSSTYTYKVTTESSDEEAPALFQVYAKFVNRDLYQITNSDFEIWNSAVNEPAPGWNSFPSAVGSMATMGKGMSPNPERVEGRGGEGYAVRLFSKYAGMLGIGANANGNLTTGVVNMGSMTATDASNHNFTNVEDPAHRMLLVGQPDSVEFYTKYKMGDGEPHTGHASFIIHDEVNYIDPEREEQAEHRIGISGVNIEESEDWVRNVGTFEYDWTAEDAAATKKFILVDFTTNVTPGGSKGDTLVIDDVRLIYNSELASAIYDGQALTFVDGAATVETTYNAELLEVLSNGRCATIECDYNRPESKLTITVKGQDYEFNPENVHVYTIQFANDANNEAMEQFIAEYESIQQQFTQVYNATVNNEEYQDEKYAEIIETMNPVLNGIQQNLATFGTWAEESYEAGTLVDEMEEILSSMEQIQIQLTQFLNSFNAAVAEVDAAETFALNYESLQQQFTQVYNVTVNNEEYQDEKYAEVIETMSPVLNGIQQNMATLSTWADESLAAGTLADDLEEILVAMEQIQIQLTQFLNSFNGAVAEIDAAETFALNYESLQQQFTQVYNVTVNNEEYQDEKYAEVIETMTPVLSGIQQNMAVFQTWAEESYAAGTLADDLEEILSGMEQIQIQLTQFLNSFNAAVAEIDAAETFALNYESLQQQFTQVYNATVNNPEYEGPEYQAVIEEMTPTLSAIQQNMATLSTWADESYAAGTLAADLEEILLAMEQIQIQLTQFLNSFNEKIEGIITGIQSVTASENAEKQVIFSIDGKRVANPVKGGIYIVNGKKMIIK